MIDNNKNWFSRTGTGYVLAKYGMTLVTHGLAGELEDDGIGCNTLWPRTTVATAAIRNFAGLGAVDSSRTPDIMADAAYEILTSDSRKTTN
jgi:citronellol/citronellal dehydrogenase